MSFDVVVPISVSTFTKYIPDERADASTVTLLSLHFCAITFAPVAE